jgi:hypothetical protein
MMQAHLTRWLPKPPPLADVRECACLLLLCGAMIFSVLNIGVHRLAERLWEPINHGLSPDGKEYVSISRAGLRVHDVETGRETQRVTWKSPWGEQEISQPGFGPEPAYIFEGRDESTNYDWHGNELESKLTTEISPSKQFVIGKFPGGCVLWWDRLNKRVRVQCFPEHIILRCYIDEGNDRYLLECIRYPKTFIQRACLKEPDAVSAESLLGRRIDIFEFRLGDNAQLATFPDLRVGAPVDHDFQIRLVAEFDGTKPILQHWRDFPRGEPETTLLAPCEGLSEIADCQISLHAGSVLIDEEEKRIILPPLSFASEGRVEIRELQRSSMISNSMKTPRAVNTYRDQNLLGYEVVESPGEYRFCDIEYFDRLRDLLCRDAADRQVLRAADEHGRVWDLPTSRYERPIRRQLRMKPYPFSFAISLASVASAWSIWSLNAAWSRTLLNARGWFVILVSAIWIPLNWGVEIAVDDGGIAVAARLLVAACCGLLLSLSTALVVSRGPGWRPACVALVLILAIYFNCAFGNHVINNYSF